MKDYYEIKRANANELLTAAINRVKQFPLLREIYDDKFLVELVRNKGDHTNSLLFWLVNDNQFESKTTEAFLRTLDSNLSLFHNHAGFEMLKRKLRNWRFENFNSTIAELNYSADYVRKGFTVELEPILANNKKGDFCISKGTLKIYFEIKVICDGDLIEDDAIINDITDRLGNVKHNYRISITFEDKFSIKSTIAFSKWLIRELRDQKTASVSLRYKESDVDLATVDLKQLPSGETGFIGGFVYGGGIKGDWADVRRKIVSGVKQLHPDFPGVIIVVPYSLSINESDLLNALCGDLRVRFNALKSEAIRGGDRIFSPNKNKRLSAVVFEHNSNGKKSKIVYHNPFSVFNVPYELFDGPDVKHFPEKMHDT